MEKSSFFDAILNELGDYDRVYSSREFAQYFASFIGNGVFPNPSTNLMVLTLDNNMIVRLSPGKAWINGYFYSNSENMPIRVNDADAAFNRKDSIVIQLSHVRREIKAVYKPGIANTNPLPPAVIRNDDVFELKVAEITVPSGANRIEEAHILDTRHDRVVCGLVTHVVTSIDTTALYRQYENYLNTKIAEWNNTKLQQQQDWQNQMNHQSQTFNTHHAQMWGWFNEVNVEITKLKGFDFDNWLELRGTSLQTNFNGDGSITETIVIIGINKKVAERHTIFPVDGSIVITITVYASDGVSVDRQAINTTVFNGDGTITANTHPIVL